MLPLTAVSQSLAVVIPVYNGGATLPALIERLLPVVRSSGAPYEIILVNDGPSMGGFINPYTVPLCAFWKLGQSKPGEIYNFRAVTVDEAQAISRRIRDLCTEDSIE